MKLGFYPKLAWTGMKNNKKTSIPYILTCIGMVMMYYIISFLTMSEDVRAMRGGDEIQAILSIGCGVIGIFALIFLFYTNSFLIRRRKKEFGLYNILGMGKKNIAFILFWENVITSAISLILGLSCGILFSKLAELCVLKLWGGSVNFSFSISVTSIIQSVVLFSIVFTLIFLNSLRQIQISKPIDLIKSENQGEKPPKANWLIAVIGAILLGAAYYISIITEDPLSALSWFFIAVTMVVIATYMLFISGFVTMCRLLQKNKRYYYKAKHFVSTSSMVYRMKRNGAGLASICILLTMVLVMISSTACLFFGAEDSLNTLYQNDIVVDADSWDEEAINTTKSEVTNTVYNYSAQIQDTVQYHYVKFYGYLENNNFVFSFAATEEADYNKAALIFIIPIEDYNALTGSDETLQTGEIIVQPSKLEFDYDTLEIENFGTLNVKKTVNNFVSNGEELKAVYPALYIFTSDPYALSQTTASLGNPYDDFEHYYYGVNLNSDDETQIKISQDISESLSSALENSNVPGFSVTGRAESRKDFYTLYGGLFALGIILGVVFLFGAVLIIYYKQISEGYEDRAKFDIMQKVGMTKKEIRKSINSQVLTVFFLPILVAGIHVAFAFPLIYRLILLLGITNMEFLLLVTLICFLIFGLFYIIVYKLTSRAYYGIVSRNGADNK